ncbi:MAG: fibronectin type III domain-containing protein [bacterium]
MKELSLAFATLLLWGAAAFAAAEGAAPAVTARDAPNDAGAIVNVAWEPAPAEKEAAFTGYEVQRRGPGEEEFATLAETGPGETSYRDQEAQDGVAYEYRVRALTATAPPVVLGTASAEASGQWFNTARSNAFIGVIFVTAVIVFFIYRSKGGAELFVRKIAGLEAVDEAIGRATEMGKPILYVTGLGDASDIATIAAMTILAKVARKTAEYETPLIVPCYDPIVMIVEKEMVKQAYTEAGKPDAFDEDSVFFVTQSQFGYVAAVDGIMLREKPATNFYMGAFYAESLILAETGAETGAIQIAGTDRVTQLPFFITACDYTLMGEELYAATAYLGRDPLFLGSLKGQDWAKGVIMAFLILGTILLILSTDFGLRFAKLFETAG